MGLSFIGKFISIFILYSSVDFHTLLKSYYETSV